MKFHIKHLKQYGYSENPWLVYRADIKGKHSHVKSEKVALSLIGWLLKGVQPNSEYLYGSACKLLTKEELSKLKVVKSKKKQKYHNVTIKKTRCLK